MRLEKIVSYIFHPVLFGTITTIFFFIFQPSFVPKSFQLNVILVIFFSTYVIPVLFLFLLKSVKSIDSYHLVGVEERKFPVFFFIALNSLLVYRLFFYDNLRLLAIFFMASAISLGIVFLFLLKKIKLSLHTLGLGLFTSFLIVLSYHFKTRLLVPISVAILLSSIVATVRLKLNAHTNFEAYFGFILGVLMQIIVFLVIYKM